MLNVHMHGLTARLLLIVIALGIFQPLLEAFSAEPPHACCQRRLHGAPNSTSHFQAPKKSDGSCCPPLTTPHTAQVRSAEDKLAVPQCSQPVRSATHAWMIRGFESHNSSRAPPVSPR
jgi:hypothetical protein